jgi:hypothetical protein
MLSARGAVVIDVPVFTFFCVFINVIIVRFEDMQIDFGRIGEGIWPKNVDTNLTIANDFARLSVPFACVCHNLLKLPAV